MRRIKINLWICSKCRGVFGYPPLTFGLGNGTAPGAHCCPGGRLCPLTIETGADGSDSIVIADIPEGEAL